MSIDHITPRETVLYAAIEKLEATNKELLEALKSIVYYGCGLDPEDYQLGQEAIARATGEKQ